MGQRMQETLYQTGDSVDTLWGKWLQDTLYETADAGDTLSDWSCRRHSMRQGMKEALYESADEGDTL